MKGRNVVRLELFDAVATCWDRSYWYPDVDGPPTYWNINRAVKCMPQPYTMFAAFDSGGSVVRLGNVQ